MTNHPNRNRAPSGYVPTPEEVRTARGALTQAQAAAMVYTRADKWGEWELGKRRMHPTSWELFLIKSVQNS